MKTRYEYVFEKELQEIKDHKKTTKMNFKDLSIGKHTKPKTSSHRQMCCFSGSDTLVIGSV